MSGKDKAGGRVNKSLKSHTQLDFSWIYERHCSLPSITKLEGHSERE